MSRSADTLMDSLPPVGWADVAMKHDLARLGDRLDGRIDVLERRMDLRFGGITTEILASVRADMLRMMLGLLGFVVAFVVALVTLT